MTPTAVAFGAAGVLALIDWRAVWTRNRSLEYVAKPAVMVALILAAITIDAPSTAARGWFVAALTLSLAGDVFLVLRKEQFIAGLASFLLAHVAYVVGLVASGVGAVGVAVGAAIATVAAATIGRRVLGSVRSSSPALVMPVVAYMVAISAMVMAATGSGVAAAIAGALLFYASDAMLAWNRFVQPTTHGRMVVIVPYHLGQAFLVAALASL